jgi:DNA invertase Pin-like site-specific DNA recombinase
MKRATSDAKKLIAYYRVSTEKQGRSGLGLDAQKAAVESYARSVDAVIVAPPYVEVESGKRSDRPKLAAALSHAKCIGATLVVAKLDRLARNVAFLAALMESGVDFVACDQPHANRLTIHILAAVAEDEAKRISDRTVAALAAYKRRGGRLGASRPECRNLTQSARIRGARAAGTVATRLADEAYRHYRPIVTELRAAGRTLRQIADHLNASGYTTRRGCPWNATQVMRVIDRAE